MQTLIEKIRKARETTVKTGGFSFTVRRPTDLEASLYTQQLRQSDILRDYVTGWDGVKESDIIPGGTGDLIEFEHALFMEWIADRPGLWADLVNEITSSYTRHQKKQTDIEKKL